MLRRLGMLRRMDAFALAALVAVVGWLLMERRQVDARFRLFMALLAAAMAEGLRTPARPWFRLEAQP